MSFLKRYLTEVKSKEKYYTEGHIMKNSITPGQISQNNLKLIYQYIYKNGPVSQQDIAFDLRLSRPTIKTKIEELESRGLIRKDGQIASDLAGRKAAAYSIDPEYRFAIGVEILKTQVKLLRVDLIGRSSCRTVLDLAYENSDLYVTALCGEINRFIDSLPSGKDRILGIGLSFPGLVNADATEILYGNILDCTGLNIAAFRKHLSFPCRFLHDADAAADSELWASPELKDFLYLNISVHLGASVIHNRKIVSGLHGYSATIEHIQIDPKGKLCYCGKRGCTETFCSLSALLDGDDEETFFRELRAGNAAVRKRWKKYLHYTALVINNMHLLYDTVFVLGGYMAVHLLEEDIEQLYDEISKMTPFPEVRDYIRISKMPKHSITIGAALPYIREFLEGELID